MLRYLELSAQMMIPLSLVKPLISHTRR